MSVPRLVLSIALGVAAPALADSNQPAAPLADVQLADASAEARARTLMEEVRCLVCQGQSIADSNAEMAGDMRSLIRERIAGGERPEAIRAWLIRRYGNWISYDPPLDRTTLVLWALPVVALAAGVMLTFGTFRRRRR